MKRVITAIVICLCSLCGFGQDRIEVTEQDYANAEVEMADQFRADGKIYILTGIILIILFGTVFYLFTIDRKVSKLEKELGNHTD